MRISKRLAEKIRKQNKRTRDRNYRFRKMSPQRQRVTIARDVLALLDAGRISAESGTYLEIDPDLEERYWDDTSTEEESADLHEVLEKTETCEVCGIGACFVAAVLRNDRVTTSQMRDTGDDAFMRSYLRSWFDTQQIRLIEAAFERSFGFAVGIRGDVDAVAFGSRYEDDDDRLRAIFQNIVDNGGTFDP